MRLIDNFCPWLLIILRWITKKCNFMLMYFFVSTIKKEKGQQKNSVIDYSSFMEHLKIWSFEWYTGWITISHQNKRWICTLFAPKKCRLGIDSLVLMLLTKFVLSSTIRSVVNNVQDMRIKLLVLKWTNV